MTSISFQLLSDFLLVDDFVSQRGCQAGKKNPVPGNRTGSICSVDESFVINYVTVNQSVKFLNTLFSTFLVFFRRYRRSFWRSFSLFSIGMTGF
jgi:hypothetical protein